MWGLGLPSGANGKESACQCRRLGFDHWVSTMPWRRKWQLAPILLPAKPHGQRSLAGYSPWGHKEMNVTECMRAHLPTHTHTPPPQHTRGILVLWPGTEPLSRVGRWILNQWTTRKVPEVLEFLLLTAKYVSKDSYPDIYHFCGSHFISDVLTLLLVSFPSLWRISFSNSFRESLLAINYLSFPSSEKPLFYLHSWMIFSQDAEFWVDNSFRLAFSNVVLLPSGLCGSW